MGGKTTTWSAPKIRKIRGEDRMVRTRLVNGQEKIEIVPSDLKRERSSELDKQIPYNEARKIARRKVDLEQDQQTRARTVYERPTKRWAKDPAHSDVQQIDTPSSPKTD